MFNFGPLLLLLLIAAFDNAVSYSNVIEEADDSIEDTESPQHFYDTRYEEDWNYYQKKQKKPIISEDAIFLAHEKYCQYFYAFDGRQSAIFKCATGYRFDVERSRCLKTKHVNCGKRKKSIDSSSSGSKSIQIYYKCPKWSGFFAHEYYCNLYYSCKNKKAELYMCPPGMLFDSENFKCAYREYVRCNKKVDPNSGDDNDLDVKPDPNDVFNCQQASGVFPHPTMCNKFVRCWFGYGDVHVCPKDYLFDIDLMQCRSKKLVYCQDRIDPHGYDDEEPPHLIDLNPDFECKVNKGRFPHENCAQFYECSNGEARLYHCPPDTRYDSKKQTCKDSSKVTCNRDDHGDDEDEEFICPAKEGIFKDTENCGSYYKCRQGKAQHLTCPKGELFDADWKDCNDENEVICGDRLYPEDDPEDEEHDNIIDDNPSYECSKLHGRFTHEEICNWYYHCKDGKPSIRVCRSGRNYDRYRNHCFDEVDCENRKPQIDDIVPTPKSRDFVCPSKSGKYAHEKDCGAFYLCQKKKYKLYYCKKGKLFHEKLKSCEDEEKVTCGNRIHPEMDPEEPEDKVVDPDPQFKCKTNHGRYSHERYCDWYYNCHDKKASLRQCRNGKYYDSKERKCRDSKDVSCDERRKPEDREIVIISTIAPTEKPEFKCPKSDGKFPHEKDCQKYYECKKGHYKLQICPKKKLYDASRRSCEDDDHVMCGDRRHPDLDPEEPHDNLIDPNPKMKCKKNHGRYVHQEYCYWYYECHDKKATIRECRRGKYYDSKKRKCVEAKEVICEGRKEIDEFPSMFECPKSDGRYAHNRDCSKYYECKGKKYKIHDCPKNELFDEKKRKCKDEEDVKCGKRIHPEDDPEAPQDEIIDPHPDFKCKKNHGRYAHQDCDKYYHCKDGEVTLRECKSGKYFDKHNNKCRNEFEVDCGDRNKEKDGKQTTSSSEASTFVQMISTISPETSETTKAEFFTVPERNETSEQTTTKQAPSTFSPETNEDITKQISTIVSESSRSTESSRPSLAPTEETLIISESPLSTESSRPSPPSTKQTLIISESPLSTESSRPSLPPTEQTKTISESSLSTESSRPSLPLTEQTLIISELPHSTGSSRPSISPTEQTLIISESPLSTESSRPSRPPTEQTLIISELPRSTEQSRPSLPTTEQTLIISESPLSTEPSRPPLPPTTATKLPCSTRSSRPSLPPTKQTPTIISDVPSTTMESSQTSFEFDDNPDKIVNPNPKYDCTSDGGDFPHETHCHYYYSCRKGKVTLRECPDGKYFDILRDGCEDWYIVSCDDRLEPDDLTPSFRHKSTPYVDEALRTEYPRPLTTEESQTMAPEFVCPQSEGLYPHEKNCGKYYFCANGVAEERMCPEDKLYNLAKRTCSDEQKTNCGERNHPMDDPENLDKERPKVIDPEPDFNCTARHGIFKHERFCKSYYHCHDNKPQLMECAGDQYFDTVRNKCLDWWLVYCGDRIGPDATKLNLETTP